MSAFRTCASPGVRRRSATWAAATSSAAGPTGPCAARPAVVASARGATRQVGIPPPSNKRKLTGEFWETIFLSAPMIVGKREIGRRSKQFACRPRILWLGQIRFATIDQPIFPELCPSQLVRKGFRPGEAVHWLDG